MSTRVDTHLLQLNHVIEIFHLAVSFTQVGCSKDNENIYNACDIMLYYGNHDNDTFSFDCIHVRCSYR